MAKTFYWDSTGTANATVSAGTTGGTTYTDSASSVTNEAYCNDQSVGAAISGWGDNEAIRLDFGSSVSATMVAFYFTASEGSDIEIYASDSATAMGTLDKDATAVFSVGWNIVDLGGTKSGRYWFFVSDGAIDYCTEIIVGDSFEFPVGYELGNTQGAVYGVDVTESYGGVESSNKRHGAKKTWNWTWNYLDEDAKDDLIAMREDLDFNHLKFIYYDDSDYNWVRLVGGLDFSEQAFQAYSTNISLLGQLE